MPKDSQTFAKMQLATKQKKTTEIIAKIADFFVKFCDAVVDVDFFGCFDTIYSISVARIFDWGGRANHKLHAMTSSQIFERGIFVGQ